MRFVTVRSVVMEAYPVIVVLIRALCSHLSCYYDNGHATPPPPAAAIRHRHVVTTHVSHPDRMRNSVCDGMEVHAP